MKNRNIDSFPFYVEPILTDCNGRARATNLLNNMFSAGSRHGETRGFGATSTLGWVIVRMGVHFERIPHKKENLRIDTWIRNLYHGFTDRCARMVDEDGNEVVSMIFTFAMIDLKTRTAVDLNGDIGLRITECVLPEEQLAIRRIPAINRTPVDEVTFKRSPHYSDIDINGHMNSMRYIDHILDAMPIEYINSHDITDMTVAYMHEGDANEELAYGIKEIGPDHYIAQVTKENGVVSSRFELRFKPRP